MKLLLSYLRKYQKTLVGAIALATINQVFSLIDPQIFRILVDNYASRINELSAQEFLYGTGLFLLLGVFVTLVARIAKNFQDYFVNVVTQKVGTTLYADMIQHAFSLPFYVFEDQRSGELLQKASKARTDSQNFITSLVNVVFLAALGMTIVIAYSFYVHWLVGVVYLLIIPLMGITTFSISKKVRSAQEKIVKEASILAGSTTETLRNVELVKSLGLEKQEAKRLNKVNDNILKLELKKIAIIRTLSFIQGSMINMIRSLLLFLLLWLMYVGQITLGEFFTLTIYSFTIFSPLYELGNVVSQYQEAKASLKIANDIFGKKPEPKPENPKTISELKKLSFNNISFGYGNSTSLSLKDISFEARLGQTVAFVGLSGSGKSTIIKLLVGLYQPSEGQILINDTDSKIINIEKWRNKIGYVSQDTQLFAGTIADNLRFIKQDATDDQCRLALKQASIDNIITRDKKGLNAKIGESGIKLSGGEKQRLAIARALLRNPQLIIFDEATSSLDSLTEGEITKTISGISQGNKELLTIIVAHRLSTVAHANVINVLEKGKIIESGSHEELLQNKSLYYAMWREQQAS